MRGRLPKLDAVAQREALSLYDEGWASTRLAKKFGVSSGTILNMIRRAERVVRHPGMQSRGGKFITQKGYRKVHLAETHPMFGMADASGNVYEHRLVLAQKLGRVLRASESVHHIDGNRKNNYPGNLQLRHGQHGKGVVLCCGSCGSDNIIPRRLEEAIS